MFFRLKELIKYKGWQIAPAELEDTILTHPGVADCGVLGVPAQEEGVGEVPRAFIVLKPTFADKDQKELAAEIDTMIEVNILYLVHYERCFKNRQAAVCKFALQKDRQTVIVPRIKKIVLLENNFRRFKNKD